MSAVTARVSNDLRNRIVAVLREDRDVRNIGALADQLEAAIRNVDPVAWLRYGEETPVQNVPFGAMWISDKDDPRAFPVYDRPEDFTPSVAVKAPQADWIKHDGKRMPVNAETIVEVRMASGFVYDADFASNWHERDGSKSNWHHDLGCPHPCDIVAYRIVTNSPALSAQVQDVASVIALSDAAYDLASWAGCINWRGGENQKEWLDDLRHHIATVKSLCKQHRTTPAAFARQEGGK
ncbi:hypothetical protein [Agrobacterium pusense]|uniref:hypothetical protein n=1 Tax=Agrobacterium pusense TaxID=648995 RepID=UPI002F3F3B71